MSDPSSVSKRRPPPDDADLKVDEQVQHFLDLKHKLTFFVITAAVGTIGFTLSYGLKNLETVAAAPFAYRAVVAGLSFAVLSVACALASLYSEISSYRLHLKYRYMRLTPPEIPKAVMNGWTRWNVRAERMLAASFITLAAAIAAQAAFYLSLLNMGD